MKFSNKFSIFLKRRGFIQDIINFLKFEEPFKFNTYTYLFGDIVYSSWDEYHLTWQFCGFGYEEDCLDQLGMYQIYRFGIISVFKWQNCDYDEKVLGIKKEKDENEIISGR